MRRSINIFSVIGWLLHGLGNLSPQLLPRNRQGAIFSENYDLYFLKKMMLCIGNSNRQYWPLHRDGRQPEDITAACPLRFWFRPVWDGVGNRSTTEYEPRLTVVVIISGGFVNYCLKWIILKESRQFCFHLFFFLKKQCS